MVTGVPTGPLVGVKDTTLGTTANFAVLLTVPPAVVMVMVLPVFAPAGMVAVIEVSDFTVNFAALVPMVTLVVWVRLTPVMVMVVPTIPLVGVKDLIWGATRKLRSLVKVPVKVVTVTGPVSAPAGTVAVM